MTGAFLAPLSLILIANGDRKHADEVPRLTSGLRLESICKPQSRILIPVISMANRFYTSSFVPK